MHEHMFNLFITFVCSATFAILFRTPIRYLPVTIFIGILSGLAIRWQPSGCPIELWTFIVSFLIGSLSHYCAKLTRTPAQGFLIPGVVFLLPGSHVYSGFSGFMSYDFKEASIRFVSGLIIAIAISFGLLLANWIAPSRGTL